MFFNRCSSNVGRQGGQQVIKLSFLCAKYTEVVIHEIGHVVGFWHEQSRPDRDDFITVLWENIQTGKKINFRKHPVTEIDSLNITYDYGSIMHYSPYVSN